ncbi:DUF1156 domain-containing protein [Mycobacterium kansasii]|uniref:DUF1156 domain-containing protein n=1 Tax=Mycobacterium kansasii TaxID=1768 RepID=UPI000F01FF95|nr:DUF1156 domain-containing protein [Mycobacterium kansasii]VAZ63158.1 hypothetical protein LAUMK22_04990 [Mycobacterium kansasii]
MAEKTKLIEVALPLEVINRESAREKSIRHGHPSTLHLWWARRPLAAARAVLFAQLVDDPSAHPDKFPTEEAQKVERERLHKIIERLVVWENINDERLLAEAKAEILKSTDGNPPPILDPFAGGGTIPLEAQRLGLEARASDLNPVAVLINKALIEFPPKFRDQPPVFPGLAESETAGWTRARGLAADIRAYGEWMRNEAEKRIGHLYPKAQLPGGGEATVIAWIWARTVTCPNPACRITAPLVRSWWLRKKKGKEAYVIPHVNAGRVEFEIGHDLGNAPTHGVNDGTVSRNGAVCVGCATAMPLAYIRAEGKAKRLGSQLMAIVVEGDRQRAYLAPSPEHHAAAQVPTPADIPDTEFPAAALGLRIQAYGMTRHTDLFTARQLTALSTFSALVEEARKLALKDSLEAGRPIGEPLEEGGSGATAYADCVSAYLALAVSRAADSCSALTMWKNYEDKVVHTFIRQAISMVWDFAEVNPLRGGAGDVAMGAISMAKVVERLPAGVRSTAWQDDAAATAYGQAVVSTDPPYYDNVPYADLSDYFYVWVRQAASQILPSLLGTVLTPKADELVADPFRRGGQEKANEFFERGFVRVFERMRDGAPKEYPVTVYYAFKQSETDDGGTASTGWEVLLEGMIRSGWAITATWPIRTELANRMRSQGSNALASSIVLCLRPRPAAAPTQDRQGFIGAMKSELGAALQKLEAGGIAPVDLPQAAIGPGMAVFSRYSAVLEPDGSRMTVRSALARINEVLDEVLSEQEGDFDATTRFAIAWFRTHGYAEGKFGDADNLARARNTSVATLERAGVLSSRAGKVRLYRPADLRGDYDVLTDEFVSAWEVLHYLAWIIESEGVGEAGEFLAKVNARDDGGVDVELIPELSHLLFRIAEDNKWTKDAISFNSLVTAWPDIVDASRQTTSSGQQESLDFDGDE